MTTVLTDNELLTLYDNHNDAIANFDTGVAVGMGVEDERRAMWDAFAAYKAAQRRLNVAILRRHEGRLARALEAREVRGWLDALAEVLGLVEKPAEAKPASKGRVRWGTRFPSKLRDGELPDTGFLRGWLIPIGDGWEWGACGRKGVAYTEAAARTALLAALRADGWEVPEDEAKPASKGKVRWGRSRYCSHDDALLVNDGNGSCVGVVDYKDGSWCWFVDKYPHHCGSRADSIAGLVAHLRAEGYDVESLK